jgi:hypothetical protein
MCMFLGVQVCRWAGYDSDFRVSGPADDATAEHAAATLRHWSGEGSLANLLDGTALVVMVQLNDIKWHLELIEQVL